MIDIEKMAKEHEQLFPLADLNIQNEKFKEEKKEFRMAYISLIEELADLIIVCCGMYRFDEDAALEKIRFYAMAAYKFGISREVEDAVNRKWNVNLKRKWEWDGKNYHHIEKKGEE